MPILGREVDLYPEELLDIPELGRETDRRWWAVHTRPRQEKSLARKLATLGSWYYLPQLEQRFRSPNGRNRTSYVPMFPGYLFLYGGGEDRDQAVETGCLARVLPVVDGPRLTGDLRQIQRLLQSGAPLTPEAKLEAGVAVRVTAGPFQGFEGRVLKRHSGDRLLVIVNYLQQGISVALDDCQVERID